MTVTTALVALAALTGAALIVGAGVWLLNRRSNPEPAKNHPSDRRFAAAMTAALAAIAFVLALTGVSAARVTGDASFGWFAYQPLSNEVYLPGGFLLPFTPLSERLADAGFIAVAVVAALLAWGALSPHGSPWASLYRKLTKTPTSGQDPKPAQFAQAAGLFVTLTGLAAHLAGVPLSLVVATGIVFTAAIVSAVFNVCIGSQIYVAVRRLNAPGAA